MSDVLRRCRPSYVSALFSIMLSAAVCWSGTHNSATSQPDRYVADVFFFIAEADGEPVRAIVSFSRGTTDIGGHRYAAECTGHLLRHGTWTHLGPGAYDCPETTLAIIPPGPNFSVTRSAGPPVLVAEFADRSYNFHLEVQRLDTLFDASRVPEYRVHYAVGPAILISGQDTIPGRAIHRLHDFTGYNRLAKNVRGYFPGQSDFTILADTAGALFIFSTDPVQKRDADARVNTNFAAFASPEGRCEFALDSVYTRWAEVDDTLHPNKPVPRVWQTFVGKHKWKADYHDVSHFFYFTGFGIFAVEGTVEFGDSTYQVTGIVEHIHARDTPR